MCFAALSGFSRIIVCDFVQRRWFATHKTHSCSVKLEGIPRLSEWREPVDMTDMETSNHLKLRSDTHCTSSYDDSLKANECWEGFRSSCCPSVRPQAPQQAGSHGGTSWYRSQRSLPQCARRLWGPTWWWAAPPGPQGPVRGCGPCWCRPPLLETKPKTEDKKVKFII